MRPAKQRPSLASAARATGPSSCAFSGWKGLLQQEGSRLDAQVSSRDSDSERLLVAWMESERSTAALPAAEWLAVQPGPSVTLREAFPSWDPDGAASHGSPLGLQTAACQDLNANRSSRSSGRLPQRGGQGADGRGRLPGAAGTVGPGVPLSTPCLCRTSRC